MNKTDLVPPSDEACFGRAIDGLAGPDQAALMSVVQDSSAYRSLEPSARFSITKAYFTCVDGDAMLGLYIIGIGVVDQNACVAQRWKGKLTPEIVASSIAHGNALDDLPPELVAQLTADVIACWSDATWWRDELALEMTRNFGAADADAACMAQAYIDTLGVEPFVARRVMTVAPFALSPEDLARMDVPGRCSIQLAPPEELHVESGSCLAKWGSTEELQVVDCSGAHNAEVTSVHDLAATHPAWPGYAALDDDGSAFCAAEVAAQSDQAKYTWSSYSPNRETWEFGHRLLTCALVRPDYAEWVGPSATAA